MKGTDGGASFAQNTQIIKDFQAFNNLGVYNSSAKTGCSFPASISYCYGGGFYYVNAYSTGSVNVRGSASAYCSVKQAGYSLCAI